MCIPGWALDESQRKKGCLPQVVFSFLKWRFQASNFLKREKKKESFFNLQLNSCNCRVLFSFYTSKVFFLLLIVTVCFLSFFLFVVLFIPAPYLLSFCVCVCVLNDFHLEEEKKSHLGCTFSPLC